VQDNTVLQVHPLTVVQTSVLQVHLVLQVHEVTVLQVHPETVVHTSVLQVQVVVEVVLPLTEVHYLLQVQ
jgi:hypothetical protein